jgi:hypothetical protein
MAKWQRVRIKIPKEYGPAERKAIAIEVLDFIRQRTKKKSEDKDGNKFQGYSSEYKKSLDFKNAGKSSKVNLTLSGEMLAEMDLISHKNGSLLLGFDRFDQDLNGKVEGNRLGTYGNKKKVTKGRDFLGIQNKDLKKVLKKFPTTGNNVAKKAEEILKAAAAAGEIVDEIEVSIDGK